MTDFSALFDKHQRVALQFSGGKDSLALLAYMRLWLDRVCVYWVNPGDPLPETVALMAQVRASVPDFKEIAGRQRESIALDGWPSDVVPIRHTRAGQFMLGEQPFMVQGRFDCCWRSLMLPLHEAMIADGITCIIRGKRSDEDDKSPSRSGDVVDGIELVYPLWDWSADKVIQYLAACDIPLPESYAHADHSFDCISCTAWQGEGLPKFLKAKHPERYQEYARRVGLIQSAIADDMKHWEV